MKSLILICLLTLTGLCSQAQQTFKGTVKDNNSNPVPGVTIILKNEKGLILKYSITNSKGEYLFSVSDTINTSKGSIEIKHIGYQTVSKKIETGTIIYDFITGESSQVLDQVVVRQSAIIQKGDTLIYKVSAFAQEEDRNIEDVIKRMPGLSVDENGKISYNGKEIGNLYVNDDDLMDGRYAGATKAIKKELIENIEVIQNHQPIKVLQNRKPSDAVGVNLKLKDENSWTLSGMSMIGVGLPEQYTGMLNTVLLNKKLKTINTLKANNSGEDYRQEISRMGGMVQNNGISSDQLLSAGTIGNPDLPRRNYYLNRSGLANMNFLVNTKNDFQFRANIQAFTDRQTLNYQSYTELYTANDTIRYTESQQIAKSPWILNGAFSVQANKKNYFFFNRLMVEAEAADEMNHLITQNTSFQQELTNRPLAIGNTLQYTPLLKSKGILDFYWSASYSKRPQNLFINDGLHKDIINDEIPYAAIRQTADLPSFQNIVSTNYLILGKKFRQNYSLLLTQQHKELISDLTLQQNDQHTNDYADAANRLKWDLYKAVATAEYSWFKQGVYEMGVNLPVTVQAFNYRQKEFQLNEQPKHIWFTPSLNLKWFINSQEYLSMSYGYNNTISDITSIYRGIILTNYRSLQANDADLQQSQSHQAGIRYNFQRTIQMLFLNAGISYSREKINSLLSATLTDNIQRTILLPIPNSRESLQFSLGGSKYSYVLKSTISAKTSYTDSKLEQLINNQLIPVSFRSFTGNFAVDTRLLKRINFNYNGTLFYNTMKQQLTTSTSSEMYRVDQQLSLGFNLFKDFIFTVQARSLYSQNNIGNNVHYWFADAKVRYNIRRWRTDVELDCTNLANVNQYELLRVSAGMSSVSQYHIRGRMALLKFSFTL